MRTRAGLRIVRVEGHVDATSEEAFHQRLHEDVTGGAATLIYLDLRAVSHLGSSAAAVLIAVTFAGRAAGRSVLLGTCSPAARESLIRTGALDLIGAPERLDARPARPTSAPAGHPDRRPARTPLTRALQLT